MSATLGAGAGTLLTPEPQRAADRGEDRRERRLVQARVLPAPGHGRAGLLLPEPLRDLPDPPTEHGVPSIDNPHSSLSFRWSSLPTCMSNSARSAHSPENREGFRGQVRLRLV